MLIKKKSLIVALVSSIVISSVMILTLVGYMVYLEIKSGEFKRTYQHLVHKAAVERRSLHTNRAK